MRFSYHSGTVFEEIAGQAETRVLNAKMVLVGIQTEAENRETDQFGL